MSLTSDPPQGLGMNGMNWAHENPYWAEVTADQDHGGFAPESSLSFWSILITVLRQPQNGAR